jgi:hypothetical protein
VTVVIHTLEEELLAIAGIAGAEIEGERDHPHGVRVQLAAGADADLVGREVQRVLAAHGMRSQLSREDEPVIPPRSVVDLADYEDDMSVDEVSGRGMIHEAEMGPNESAAIGAAQGAATGVFGSAVRDSAPPVLDPAGEAAIQVMEGPPPTITVPRVALDVIDDAPDVDEPAVEEPRGGAGVEHAVPPAGETSEAVMAAAQVLVDGVAGVTVEELSERVAVTVRTVSGTTVTRHGPATPEGTEMAAAMAAAAVASPDVAPRIVSISGIDVDGSHVINVVFEVGAGERRVGAAVVRGGRAPAVARAAWTALRG